MPFAGLSPLGILAPSQALHPIFRPQLFHDTPDHVHANIRALVPKFCHAKGAVSPIDSLEYEGCFLSFGTVKLAEALLEFLVCDLEDEKGVIDVGPGILFTIVPAASLLTKTDPFALMTNDPGGAR